MHFFKTQTRAALKYRHLMLTDISLLPSKGPFGSRPQLSPRRVLEEFEYGFCIGHTNIGFCPQHDNDIAHLLNTTTLLVSVCLVKMVGHHEPNFGD